ncbi:MAG: tyrosine--tRNA ligase [Chlamydiae bacterium CG10_big_fil_rev_8_21_14_0_10_42_34]|nr:MAG: tyrosine--tRNA ligase [Chlamydiae bacterium CG10_big_fil_rev_8_21_14_0_10_42_34]
MKNVIDALTERGFIDQMTHTELRNRVNQPIKAYVGFDPTADSLHLGNLVGIMGLAWFQKFGHTPYVVLGGATGLIGDPSGKSAERNLLDEKTLQHNVQSLSAFFKKILHFPNGPKPVILNNNDWLGAFSLVDFLRDVGKHFRIGPMMAKEMVRTRLQSDEGMSFTEFSYQILQGYDFAYLSREHGVSLQMGGSDQWGNLTAGTEFNRKIGGEPLFGLTFPLLTRSDGKKFGKSEEGAIWLSSERLSPYQFYQHLVRVQDADVIKLLKMLTFLSLEEIAKIEAGMDVPNSAQKRLAEEVTRFVHGEDGLQAALKVTVGMAPGSDAKLSGAILKELADDMPSAELSLNEVVGQKFVELAVKVGLLPSKSEGTKLIKNGGAYLNNERVTDISLMITSSHLIDGDYLLLSAGKKKRYLIKILKN